MALPDTDFSNVQPSGGRVDKYATMIVDKNRYSVPSRYAGFKVIDSRLSGNTEK